MVEQYDLMIVGGGINGAAIARDAAGRGLKVLLCERDDLASHTSSASTKLIHGGLRYLEYYEFRLVREALIEREVLLRAAPHIIRPMRFVLPFDAGLRPAWMLRLGLFLYDSLGGRKKLPGTRNVNLKKPPHKGVLEARLTRGFEYSDCWVDDARLVVLNIMDANLHGAAIKTHTEVRQIKPVKDGYKATISIGGKVQTVHARGVINAAGPWVDQLLGLVEDKSGPVQRAEKKQERGQAEREAEHEDSLRLVKGSHIVTHKLFAGEDAYIFQNKDNRIIFVIPYEEDFTLIGTTDVPYSLDEGPVKISQSEIEYLCSTANEYLEQDIAPSDVRWTYSGVRPLYDDHAKNASAVTRDYVLDIKEYSKGHPLLSVYGGKITTSRKLAEHAMEKLSEYFPDMGEDWTAEAVLPGGNIKETDFDDFFEKLSHIYPWLQAGTLRRLARNYGTHITRLIGDARNWAELGQDFGCGLSEAEVTYLIEHEWARSAEDVLWRRSKIGVHMTTQQIDGVKDWFKRWV